MTYQEYLRYLRMLQEQQGDDEYTNVIDPSAQLAVGQEPPSSFLTGLMSLIAPPVGIAMQAQRMADQGGLPFGLNKIFASRSSANVEPGIPQAIQTGQSFVDEAALTGGDSGGSFDGASSMESYSQDPTGYSGSF
tara:strand:+ start:512 stop:916 length:405 start_codon:yes stop_codon:yes gene_type:complete